jgi:DNA polymerase III delta prime subunit
MQDFPSVMPPETLGPVLNGPVRTVPEDSKQIWTCEVTMGNGDRQGIAEISPLDLNKEYRPRRLGDVLGQAHLRRPLEEMLSMNQIPSTLLLSGPPGVGKTSVARIVGAALNCTQRVDADPCGECAECVLILAGKPNWGVVEINAASEGGIDQARWVGRCLGMAVGWNWVFIWDEAQRITPEASDALLKILEEPPAGATFILVTTDPARIRKTVRSRATTLVFERVAEDVIRQRLEEVAAKRAWTIDADEMTKIVSVSDGSPREAMKLLGWVASGGSLDKRTDTKALVAELVTLAADGNFGASGAKLDDLLQLLEPPQILDAISDVVFDVLRESTGTTGAAIDPLREIPESRLASLLSEFARTTVPRGLDGVSALRRVVGLIHVSLWDPEGRGQRPGSVLTLVRGGVDREEAENIASRNWRCPNARPSGLRRPLKDGTRVPDKPCDKADCEVCASELALDYVEAVVLARPDAYVIASLSLDNLGWAQDSRQRLRSRVKKARDRLGQIAWAWYALEDAGNLTIHAVVRLGEDLGAASSIELSERFCRAFGDGSSVVVEALDGMDLVKSRFLSGLTTARSGSREQAAAGVASHLRWNGSSVVHTSSEFWLDERGRPLGPPSPKDKAQKLGRRHRTGRGR